MLISYSRLKRWPGEHRYTYYDTGSLEYQKDDSSNIEKMYEYTPANLLSQVVHGDDEQNDPKSLMEWDADGNRVSFTSSSTSGTWYFVYDPVAGIPAVAEEYDGTSSAYYIREPGGELIARVSGESGSVLRYYQFDALGSTRLLTDNSGNVTDTYTYDAWGRQIDHTGDMGQPYRFVGRRGYYTHHQDTNLFTEGGWQLLQLGVRLYDTTLGRFMVSDSVDEAINWYAYVADRPTVAIDPSGLFNELGPESYQECEVLSRLDLPQAYVKYEGKYCRTVKRYKRMCALGCAVKLGIDAGAVVGCLAVVEGIMRGQGDLAACIFRFAMTPDLCTFGHRWEQFKDCLDGCSYSQHQKKDLYSCKAIGIGVPFYNFDPEGWAPCEHKEKKK